MLLDVCSSHGKVGGEWGCPWTKLALGEETARKTMRHISLNFYSGPFPSQLFQHHYPLCPPTSVLTSGLGPDL